MFYSHYDRHSSARFGKTSNKRRYHCTLPSAKTPSHLLPPAIHFHGQNDQVIDCQFFCLSLKNPSQFQRHVESMARCTHWQRTPSQLIFAHWFLNRALSNNVSTLLTSNEEIMSKSMAIYTFITSPLVRLTTNKHTVFSFTSTHYFSHTTHYFHCTTQQN